MPTKKSRRLVVDASVAGAAGGAEASHHTSKNCRDFLMAMLKICHRLVMTPEIEEEWDKHQSRVARGWRVQMKMRRKIDRPEGLARHNLSSRITKTSAKPASIRAMLKDVCLLEAALATEKRVVSLDEKARELFTEASEEIREIGALVWVNPDRDEESPLEWLKAGARAENKRCLRSRHRE